MSRLFHIIGQALAHAALYADALANSLRTGTPPHKRQAIRDEIILDRTTQHPIPVYSYRGRPKQ